MKYRSTVKPLIAVVDDDSDDQLIIQEAFAANSYPVTVLCFSRPAELEAYLDAHAGTQEQPNLILLDLYNDGLLTLDSIDRIKSSPASTGIPVVMMSGSSGQGHIEQFYRIGGSSYITKPLSFEEWKQTLAVLCQYWFSIVSLP